MVEKKLEQKRKTAAKLFKKKEEEAKRNFYIFSLSLSLSLSYIRFENNFDKLLR